MKTAFTAASEGQLQCRITRDKSVNNPGGHAHTKTTSWNYKQEGMQMKQMY